MSTQDTSASAVTRQNQALTVYANSILDALQPAPNILTLNSGSTDSSAQTVASGVAGAMIGGSPEFFSTAIEADILAIQQQATSITTNTFRIFETSFSNSIAETIENFYIVSTLEGYTNLKNSFITLTSQLFFSNQSMQITTIQNLVETQLNNITSNLTRYYQANNSIQTSIQSTIVGYNFLKDSLFELNQTTLTTFFINSQSFLLPTISTNASIYRSSIIGNSNDTNFGTNNLVSTVSGYAVLKGRLVDNYISNVLQYTTQSQGSISSIVFSQLSTINYKLLVSYTERNNTNQNLLSTVTNYSLLKDDFIKSNLSTTCI